MIVKSYARFFLDTNFFSAIPDEEGERRIFAIACSSYFVNNEDHFIRLNAVIADDHVIRALFDFLMARDIKERYFAKDIPIGPYQQDLRNANRSAAETFICQFVESKPIREKDETTHTMVDSPTKITTSPDELVNFYNTTCNKGDDKSKASVMKLINIRAGLGTGLTRTKGRKMVGDSCGGVEVYETWVTEYHWDLTILRKRYGLDHAEGHDDAKDASGAPIDCERQVDEWLEKREATLVAEEEGESVSDGMTDEEDVDGSVSPRGETDLSGNKRAFESSESLAGKKRKVVLELNN